MIVLEKLQSYSTKERRAVISEITYVQITPETFIDNFMNYEDLKGNGFLVL